MAEQTLPFTPFHLGPGAFFKAIGGDRFSFVVFGGSQVLMDVEPLVRMIRGDAVLHGLSHNIVGALVVATASAAFGRPIGNIVLRLAEVRHEPIGWGVAISSALLGTYSHISLDALMHSDMGPLWPLAEGNILLSAVSHRVLHWSCVASGVAAAGWMASRALRRG